MCTYLLYKVASLSKENEPFQMSWLQCQYDRRIFFFVCNNRKKSHYENIAQIETAFVNGLCDISLIAAVILLSASQNIIYKCFKTFCG
jgi:hypothetical protein